MKTDAPLPAAGSCPDFEALSAWHDAALADAGIDTHIRQCASCQESLHDIESLDLAIQQHLEEVLPDSRTVAQIITNTRRHIQPRRLPILTFRSLLRVAACVAALLIVFAIKMQLDGQQLRASATETLVVLPEPEVAEVDQRGDLSPLNRKLIDDLVREFGPLTARPLPVIPPAGASEPGPRMEQVSLPAPRGAPTIGASTMKEGPMGSNRLGLSSDINLVWYSPPAYEPASGTPSTPGEMAMGVRDRVRHVWLVKDASAPLQELQQLLPRHKQDFQELINQQRDEYVLQLVISDNDLQELVDHFDSLDFKLISPAMPQPGDGKTMKLTGKSVQYEVDFIRK